LLFAFFWHQSMFQDVAQHLDNVDQGIPMLSAHVGATAHRFNQVDVCWRVLRAARLHSSRITLVHILHFFSSRRWQQSKGGVHGAAYPGGALPATLAVAHRLTVNKLKHHSHPSRCEPQMVSRRGALRETIIQQIECWRVAIRKSFLAIYPD
jgi:hypothetical protein